MTTNNIDYNIIKQAHVKTSYTPHQMREIRKCMNDPIYFMENYLRIQHPVRGAIKFEPYDFQKRLIECYWKNISSIALLPRQSGKCCINSTIITIKQNSTGEIYDIPIGQYYEWAVCMRDGTPLPDISQYTRKKEK